MVACPTAVAVVVLVLVMKAQKETSNHRLREHEPPGLDEECKNAVECCKLQATRYTCCSTSSPFPVTPSSEVLQPASLSVCLPRTPNTSLLQRDSGRRLSDSPFLSNLA